MNGIFQEKQKIENQRIIFLKKSLYFSCKFKKKFVTLPQIWLETKKYAQENTNHLGLLIPKNGIHDAYKIFEIIGTIPIKNRSENIKNSSQSN